MLSNWTAIIKNIQMYLQWRLDKFADVSNQIFISGKDDDEVLIEEAKIKINLRFQQKVLKNFRTVHRR